MTNPSPVAGENDHAADVIGIRDDAAGLRARVATLEAELASERAQRGAYERFARLVAHDLRGALTTLLGIGQVAVKPDLRDGLQAELVRRIAPTAERATRLLERLYSHAQAGVVDVRWTVTDLDALVAEVCDDMAALLVVSGSRVERPQPLPSAWCDPDLVHQLVHNLLANAVRHGAGPDGATHVTVTAATVDDEVVITLADHGPGFEPGMSTAAFELGQRRPGPGGLGLGLATARTIVERHGGRIWVEDLGDGAVVRFSLPVVPGDGQQLITVDDVVGAWRPTIHRLR